jgi:excisionase family DNA binding protein
MSGSTVVGMSDLPAFLSAREAAALLGVSERTVRRWLVSGQLRADKRGGIFRIPRTAVGGHNGQAVGQDRPAAADAAERPEVDSAAPLGADAVRDGTDTGAAADRLDTAATLELVRLVDRLQREVVARTEAATLWQARAEFLGAQLAQAQERIKALEAPDDAQDENLSEEDQNAVRSHSRCAAPGGRSGVRSGGTIATERGGARLLWASKR